jgi:hypothetical protein
LKIRQILIVTIKWLGTRIRRESGEQRGINDSGRIANLRRLFNAQLEGDPNARKQLEVIHAELMAYRTQRIYFRTDKAWSSDLSQEQSWALAQIMDEWHAMFAYSSGYLDGIPALLALLEMVERRPKIDVLDLFRSAPWKQLVRMRGPVEGIAKMRCKACNTEYVVIFTNGHMDMAGLVCSQCGNVWFHDVYGKKEIPSCECGGVYHSGCPKCGSFEREEIQIVSPYEYFRSHSYQPDNR